MKSLSSILATFIVLSTLPSNANFTCEKLFAGLGASSNTSKTVFKETFPYNFKPTDYISTGTIVAIQKNHKASIVILRDEETSVTITNEIKENYNGPAKLAELLKVDGGVEVARVPGDPRIKVTTTTKVFDIPGATCVTATPVEGLFIVGKQDGSIQFVHFNNKEVPAQVNKKDMSTHDHTFTNIPSSAPQPQFSGNYKSANSIKNVIISKGTLGAYQFEGRWVFYDRYNISVLRADGTVQKLHQDLTIDQLNAINKFIAP